MISCKRLLRQILLPVCVAVLTAARPVPDTVSSPDGSIRLTFQVLDGVMTYAVDVDGRPFLLPSPLGLEAEGQDLSGDFQVEEVHRAAADETWTLPWGENKVHVDRHNEMAVRLRGRSGTALTLRFRVFDDGLGFRYEYEVPSAGALTVTGERTEFRFAADGDSWSAVADAESYEKPYRRLPLSAVDSAATPMTLRTRDGLYASLHEAALYDFPEMYLRRTEGTAFAAELACDSPRNRRVKAVVPGTFRTAWRTVQIARTAVGLINSSLILNLNDPCVLEDVSWIRPAKYVGVWWGMHLGIEAWYDDGRHGATTENALRYIDFAAKNGIDAVLFEGWNKGWETWGNGESFDFTVPADDFDMDRVLRHAREKGVAYILHHETGGNVLDYERQLETALDWAAARGIRYLKTGYAGWLLSGHYHHSQYGVRHYQKVVEEAARRRIVIDAHEPIKPTGIRRTWPNFMTREGARGMEWNAWSREIDPAHHEILPFTRLLAGPMDYTPGIFDLEYRAVKGNPRLKVWNGLSAEACRVPTTLAKQIANWVVLYSPLQMASDLIDNYEGHPAFRFFRDFNADCDWSEALQGEIGEFVAVVRRAGDRFFYGATTNEEGRTLEQPLTFLRPGVRYVATIYADGPGADWRTDPYDYAIRRQTVTAADTLSVVLAPGGGQAITFIPEVEIPAMAEIPAGTFYMGSNGWGYDYDEAPVHRVRLSRSFRMSVTEITNAQFEAFRPEHRALRGAEAGLSSGDDEAVAYVSWEDAAAYCRWLSERTGRRFRLPTEAEWEYACRAGTYTLYSTGDGLDGAMRRNQQTERNLRKVDLRVGRTRPNAFGLYDMHGNVEEWCLDWYGPYQPQTLADPAGPSDGDFKVTRGGSHNTPDTFLRSANRSAALPTDAHSQIGFRIVESDARLTYFDVTSGDRRSRRDGTASRRAGSARKASAGAWSAPTEAPVFLDPIPYVLKPTDGSPFYHHNHQPAVTWCSDGSLLAVWFSCDAESGREMVVLGSRFRDGRWSPASLFFKVPDRNMTGSALCRLPDGKLLHVNGVGNSGDWQNLAMAVRFSEDDGRTWTAPQLVSDHGKRHQVIAGTIVLDDGTLVQCCDAGPEGNDGTAVHFSTDGGRTWTDPWDGRPLPLVENSVRIADGAVSPTIAGIHAGLVERRDGSLLAFGRGNSVVGADGKPHMPRSVSTDRGRSWTVTASPFPPIDGGQRLVLLRLQEGPILLVSFTDHPQRSAEKGMMFGEEKGYGLFVALSYDEGETWPVRKLLTDGNYRFLDGGAWTGFFEMDENHAEPRGYFAATQSPDGIIHILSSRLHYRINLPWILSE